MATLDRYRIMRIAVYELMYRPDIPTSVAISEAVEAATELSSDESRRYVNGILGRIARELGRPETEQPSDPGTRGARGGGGLGLGFGLGLRGLGRLVHVAFFDALLELTWARPTERVPSPAASSRRTAPPRAMMPTTIHSGPIYPTTFTSDRPI
jgi:hypothetical protein